MHRPAASRLAASVIIIPAVVLVSLLWAVGPLHAQGSVPQQSSDETASSRPRPPAGQIAGFVVLRTSRGEVPLAGVQVVARSDEVWIQRPDNPPAAADAQIYPPPPGSYYTATTRADGSYIMRGVRPGDYTVTVLSASFASVELPVTVRAYRTSVADLVLRRNGARRTGIIWGVVRGKKRGQRPRPISGAEILVLPEGPYPSVPQPALARSPGSADNQVVVPPPDDIYRTVTDARGRYEIEVPAGPATIYVSADGFAPQHRFIRVPAGRRVRQNFLLRELGEIVPLAR